MKKRLSICIYSLASGGAERVVSILLDELKDEFDITLVLMNNTIFYHLPQDVDLVYIENSKPFENGFLKLLKLPLLALKYKKICKDKQIDISFSFMNRPNYINILSNMFGNKIKIIISERIAPSQEYKTNSIKDMVSRFLIKYLYPKADVIIPNSLGIKLDLINDFDIPSSKINVIHNPINLEKVYKLSKEIIDYDFSRFTFITIGRLQNQKNHKLMISSFADVKNINSQLLIIGSGELESSLKNQICNLGLENRVFLLGNQENPYKYLSKADCFVFSSDYEGFQIGRAHV